MEDYLIFVAAAGGVRELGGLVSVQGARHVVYHDDNVVLSFVSLGFIVLHIFGLCRFFGPDALALAAHVALLGLLGLVEKLIDIFDFDKRPGELVSLVDGLEQCDPRRETRCAMEVADGRIEAREIISVVDCLPCRGSVLHEHRKVFNNFRRPQYLVH